MKTFNKIFCAVAALSLLAVSCVKEEMTQQATSISTDVTEIKDLADSKVPEQVVKITCDGYWIAEAPSWITVAPTYGTGNGQIVLKFEDNLDNLGNMKAPRSGEVVIVAGEKLSTKIAVSQIGDKKLLMKKLPYEVDFTKSQDLFTIVDKVLPEGLSYIWSQTSQYGMKGSAYKDANKDGESWLVSPEVNLSSAAAAILSFEHAYNYVSKDKAPDYLKLVVTSDGGNNWTPVAIPEIGPGGWTFANSGNIDLSAYLGKVVQFAFAYTSDTANGPTWEIKNLKFVEEVPASIALDKTSVEVSSAGDAFELNVFSASTTWNLASDVDWLTLSQTSGTGNAKIDVTAAAGDDAEGVITLSAEGLDPVQCTVRRVSYVTKTIAEVLATTKGETVKTKGAIAAISKQGYVISDNTGAILIYSKDLTANVVGDTVSVVGKVGSYNNGPQIEVPAQQEKVGSAEYKYPAPKLIDAAAAEAYKTLATGSDLLTVEYVKVIGTVSASGNYLNLVIDGTDMQGSVYQATDAQKAEVTALNGKKVELCGMVTSISKSGGSPKYINVVMTSVEEYSETVAHALASKGKNVTVVGQVTAISNQGYVVTDETGSILAYTKSLTSYQIGDKLRITAKVDSYNNGPELVAPFTEEKLSSGSYEYGAAKLIDAAAAEAYKTLATGSDLLTVEYVKIRGTLSVSGNNVNVAIDGSDMQGSIYQATAAQKETASGLAGKTVDLYGMLTAISKSGSPKVPKYINVVMTSLSKAEQVPVR